MRYRSTLQLANDLKGEESKLVVTPGGRSSSSALLHPSPSQQRGELRMNGQRGPGWPSRRGPVLVGASFGNGDGMRSWRRHRRRQRRRPRDGAHGVTTASGSCSCSATRGERKRCWGMCWGQAPGQQHLPEHVKQRDEEEGRSHAQSARHRGEGTAHPRREAGH